MIRFTTGTRSSGRVGGYDGRVRIQARRKSDHLGGDDYRPLKIEYQPSEKEIKQFREDGYVIIPKLIDRDRATHLADKLDSLFQGKFETGVYPDEWHWREGLSLPNVTREICNAWKCG